MALHVIGFEDWVRSRDGMQGIPNPARLLVENINAEKARGALLGDIRTHLLPVPAAGDSQALVAEFQSHLQRVLDEIQEGDSALAFGQGHPNQTGARLETQFGPRFREILLGEEGGLAVDERRAEAIVNAVNAGTGHQPIEISTDAGAYYCNWLGRALLQSSKEEGSRWFVHLPFTSSEEEAARATGIIPRNYLDKPIGFATPEQNFALFENLAIAIARPFC